VQVGTPTTSDVDHMRIHTDNVVINNTTEISEVSRAKSNKAVITMETKHTKPGYVRLILETDPVFPKFGARYIQLVIVIMA
jgi:hypothetical protein